MPDKAVLIFFGVDAMARLIDLGTVNAVDLLTGPQTLYTPQAGQFMKIYAARGYVVLDNDFAIEVGDEAAYLNWNNDISLSGGISPLNLQDYYVIKTGTPVIAALAGYTGIPLIDAPGTWQANHAYLEYRMILVSGQLWSASTGGGTSGGSLPDFAGNPNAGDTVTDNGITWTNEGDVPTTGSMHMYALVAGPV